MRDHADLDQWSEGVELLKEERWRIEVSHCKTAEVWTQIAQDSAMESDAATYAYKIADMNIKLAERCVREWNHALKQIEVNCEKARAEHEAADQLARQKKNRFARKKRPRMGVSMQE